MGDGQDTGASIRPFFAPSIPLKCGGGTSGDRGVSRAFKVLPILQTGAEGLG